MGRFDIDRNVPVGLDDGVGTAVEALCDRCDKAISSLWHRLDIFLSRGSFTQGLPQDGYAAVESPFLDEAVRPDLLQECFLFDQMSAVLDEHAQDLKNLRRERHSMTVTQQHVLRQFQAKGPELVRRPGRVVHQVSGGLGTRTGKYWRFLGAFCKDYRRLPTISHSLP